MSRLHRQTLRAAVAPAAAHFPSPCRTFSFFERHHGGANLDLFGSLGLAPEWAEDFVYATHAPEFVPLPVAS